MSIAGLEPILATRPIVQDLGGGRWVVREDLLEGGAKMRFLPYLLGDAREVVYGSPFCGGAAVALSTIGRIQGRRITLFYAGRGTPHRRQELAKTNGARLVSVSPGYMAVVQKRARDYAASFGALFLPLGFDVPAALEPFQSYLSSVREQELGDPPEVWCATGSGMLARHLGLAFPSSIIRGVIVGLHSRNEEQRFSGNVQLVQSRYKFEQESRAAAPFPSCPNYDRKAWELFQEHAQPGAVFWNVLG